MKRIVLLSVFATLTCSFSFARIWRVNNRPGITAHFALAQQAHDSAAVQNGDTLYFEHSATSYGTLRMSKRLVLMGAGAFLNFTPDLQYNLQAPALGNISLSPSAAGSIISVNATAMFDTANNVTVTRCWIYGEVILYNADSCTIANATIHYLTCRNAINEGCYNIIIHNSIMNGISAGPFASSSNNACYLTSNLICYNNSILGQVVAAGTFYNNMMSQINTDGGSPVNNNIFLQPMSSSDRRTSSINQCGDITNLFTAGNSNLFSVPPANIWANGFPNYQNDRTFALAAGSVATGAGTGGTNCGATGGPTPYVFGAQPAIPAIYRLNVAVPTTGNSIGVTISTRSNN